MKGRLIAIGDIHGCHLEFADLLSKISLQTTDQVVLLGDLINRGPDSRRVIQLARECGAVSLIGNHELRLLKYRRTGDKQHVKESDLETYRQLGTSEWSYLSRMLRLLPVPTLNTVLVHGGFLPDRPWRRQSTEVTTNVQVIDDRGRPAKRADLPDAPFWADLWRGPPFVVYGHTPRPHIYKRKWSVGLDTACVLGGHLTAYILPEKRFIQVRARQRYAT